MKKSNKQERMKLQTIIIGTCVIAAIVTASFLIQTIKYWGTVRSIDAVEREAWANRSWVAGEWVEGWSDELTAEYNSAVAAKEKLAQENDVARWCYYSGYSVTGQILRASTILGALVVCIGSQMCIIYIVVVSAKMAKKQRNKIVRHHHARESNVYMQ